MMLATTPSTDPTALQIAVIAGKLEAAVMREDYMQTLISTADLDRMVRSLSPQHRAAALQAQAVITRALGVLEAGLLASQFASPREGQMRAAYRNAAAA